MKNPEPDNMKAHSHRRLNWLTGEYVLVSPQRTDRPWKGQVETPDPKQRKTHDPDCYLCPGASRAGDQVNPAYRGFWAFDNDFPALSPVDGRQAPSDSGFFREWPESGRCRVVCYTERHDLSLSTLAPDQITAVLESVFREFSQLDSDPDIAYVQIFENRGEAMGCSNPHPHAQIWATEHIPSEPQKESRCQADYLQENGSSLLLDVIAAEIDAGDRLLAVNDHAVSLVPFWATWPFETLIVPRLPAPGPGDLEPAAIRGFGEVLQLTLQAYDRLFSSPMPYSMGFHARPSDGHAHPEWQFHAHLYPPLLRSATVRKHMVGFEMLGMPQRDLTPEAAAKRLRATLEKRP